MSFFSSIKDNLHHGGVKLQLEAPDSAVVSSVIPISVTLTADTSQTINSIAVELKLETRQTSGNNQVSSPGYNTTHQAVQTIAQVESHESLNLSAGESRTVQLQLSIPPDAVLNQGLASLGGSIGGALQTLAQLNGSTSHLYSLHVHADVAGIKLDPGTHQNIQLLPSPAPATGTL